MDVRKIEYRNGIPFYPVTFPFNKADGLLIQDIQLQDQISYLNKNKIVSVFLSGMPCFEFVKQCAMIEHLTIELKLGGKYYSSLIKRGSKYIKKYNVEPLYSLQNLKSLTIIDLEESFIVSDFTIDLTRFPELELYSGDYKFTNGLERAHHIKTLWLNNYPNDSIVGLSGLTNLDSFTLCSSRIKSLDGCERMSNLQCLYLYRNRNLENISAITALKPTLRALRIEYSSKISDFSYLGEMTTLKLLGLVGSNKIASISFICKMKELQTFVFTIDIQDGNLTPCLRLSYASCPKGRRYYNLRDDQLPKGAYIRGNECIEEWRRTE